MVWPGRAGPCSLLPSLSLEETFKTLETHQAWRLEVISRLTVSRVIKSTLSGYKLCYPA